MEGPLYALLPLTTVIQADYLLPWPLLHRKENHPKLSVWGAGLESVCLPPSYSLVNQHCFMAIDLLVLDTRCLLSLIALAPSEDDVETIRRDVTCC